MTGWGSVLSALISRLSTPIALQFAAIVALSRVLYWWWSDGEVDFYVILSLLSLPLLLWHGLVKPCIDKRADQRRERERRALEREREQKAQEAKGYRYILQARSAVEAALDTASLHGGIDPLIMGRQYAAPLEYARNATNAVAPLIENPPPPLGKAASVAELQAWLAVLENAQNTAMNARR